MIGFGTPALVASLISFLIFFGNVAVGAAGIGAYLGDIAEMLMLVAASVFFVIGILAREASVHDKQD